MTTATHDLLHDEATLFARQVLYRFGAWTFLDPAAGAWELLASLRAEELLPRSAALLRDLCKSRPLQLGTGERPLADLNPLPILDRLPGSRAELNKAFEATFGLLVSNSCPPYETEYIHSKFSFQRSNTLADINGFYRAFGLGISTAHRERPDHIVQEMEFMAFLIGQHRRAKQASQATREKRLKVCRQAQVRFLREHLAWWAPTFARLLSREASGGFYEAAGRFLAALIPVERTLLGIDSTGPPAEPTSLAPPDACQGCELAN
jgi:TorA maturation chaperone TorD